MSSEGSAEWELSKENIQPLKKGRKVEKLAQDPRAIEAERQTYEANLRSYQGPDPLKPWYDYILWLEQTFPKGGSEGGLNTLLTKCMTEFKTNPEVIQDPRYLEVWIKYANISTKPLDCYNFMYREKLCTEVSGFYVAWANQLEESGQMKRAEMVYKSALSKSFPPEEKEFLSHKQEQFQTRVAKKVLDDLEKEGDGEDREEGTAGSEERGALSQLKGRGKKQVVGSLRVGKVKVSSGPGALPHSEVQSESGNKGRPKFSILDENPSSIPEIILPSGPTSSKNAQPNNENLPCTPSQNRENEMSPGKWTAGRIGKKSHSVPFNQIGTKPTFEIHQDDDIEEPASTPCKIGGSALSTKKPEKDSSVAVALFEPFDPSVRPMYCKHLIYQGVSEISFEELRAIPFQQKMKEEEALSGLMEKQRKTFEDVIKKQEMLYNEKLGLLQSEISQMKEKLSTESCSGNSISSKSTSLLNNKENSSSSKVFSSNDNTPLGVGDDTKALLQECDGYSKESSQLTCGSPTVTTMNIMKNMWGSPSHQSKDQESKPSLGGGAPFKVHCDDEEQEESRRMSQKKQQPSFDVYNDSELKPPATKPAFEIFNDEPEPKPPATKPALETFNDEPKPPISKPAFEIFADPYEKRAPKISKDETKPSSFAVFEDPGPRFARPAAIPKPGIGGDTTMVVTSLEDFAEKAVVSSTPAFGKRFMPDDDENTCAVPLLFKKPVERVETSKDSTNVNATVPQNLSTIMETSRENESKSSSSSSSSSACTTTTNVGLTSTHFASSIQTQELTASESLKKPTIEATLEKTPNPPPGKRPCMKDTPKFFLQSPDDNESDEDDFDRFGDIKATYQKAFESRRPAAHTTLETTCPSILAGPREQNSFFQQSLKASFAMEERSKMDFSISSFNASASPQLDVSSPVCDVSEMDEGISELTNKMKGVLVQAVFYDLNNPFDEKIQRDILRGLKLPLSERRGFVHFDELIPRIAPHKMVQIGDTFFGMKEQIGEGAYGTIFKAIRHNNNAVNDTICEMSLVFKVQKPAREWEFYICSEVQSRLQDLGSFMAIPRCYSFSDGSIFVSEYLPASLLDILNAAKSTKMAEETFAIFFVIQLCELVHRLGQARIIHGDIKPDNIMLRRKPSLDRNAGSVEEMFPSSERPCIQLIDFGRGIDMSLAKEGTTFTHVFKSKETIIPEMMKEKPWSYQIDYFGIASTAYCLKFGSYMNLVEKHGLFYHGGHYKRWWNADLWTEFYQEFLNIENASTLPDLLQWKQRFEEVLFKKNVATDFNRIFKEIEGLGYNFSY